MNHKQLKYELENQLEEIEQELSSIKGALRYHPEVISVWSNLIAAKSSILIALTNLPDYTNSLKEINKFILIEFKYYNSYSDIPKNEILSYFCSDRKGKGLIVLKNLFEGFLYPDSQHHTGDLTDYIFWMIHTKQIQYEAESFSTAVDCQFKLKFKWANLTEEFK